MELQNEIAKLAYELYETSGRQEGRDLANWLEAERIIFARHRLEEENKIEPEVDEKVEPFTEIEREDAIV